LRSGGFDDVLLLTFPSDCIRPQAGWDKITSGVAGAERGFSRLAIIGAQGCVPNGSPPDSIGPCHIHSVEQCAHLVADKARCDTFLAEGAYLLTPGWLARWRPYLSEWGFDRNTAIQFFGEFSSRLVLLDTGVDRRSADLVKEMAGFLELPFEIEAVGRDLFRLRLENIALCSRLSDPGAEAPKAGSEARTLASDYAAAFDLIDSMAGIGTEPEIIDRMLGVFETLFAADSLTYGSFRGDNPEAVKARLKNIPSAESPVNDLGAFADEYAWTESGNGFRLLVAHQGERLGVLEVDDIAFPENKERYLNLALTVGRLCGLLIFNARTYEKIKQTEVELRKLSRAVEQSPSTVVITDLSGAIEYVNPKFVATTGYTSEEAVGLNPRVLKSGEMSEEGYKELWETITAGREWRGEFHNKRKNGELYWEFASISPIRDQSGAVTHYLAVKEDITARKEAEEAIARLAAIVESSEDAIIAKSLDGVILSWNPGAERLYGYSAKEVVGKSISILEPPDRRNELAEAMEKLRRGERIQDREVQRIRKDGARIDVWMSLSAVKGPDGKVMGASTIGRDITERKRAEEEIRRLHGNLERRAVELKSINKELEAFSYSVSHDLRAPLRSIDGFSQALLEDYDGILDDQGRDYLRRVRAASQRMAQLIDDLLALSRTTRREMTRDEVDLSGLADSIAAELQRNGPERRVEFVIQPGLVARGDSHLLGIVLENLLGNAWKFTNRRSIAKIEFGATQQDGKAVYFVRDNGVGFDPAYTSRLFGAFQRLHASTEFPGTGIGLATVQRIIHRHGGRIWPESALDEGTTFYFTL